MKSIGRGSIASVLKWGIDIFYFLTLFAGVLLLLVISGLLIFHDSAHLTVHPRVLLHVSPDAFEVLPGTGTTPRVQIERAWAELEVEGVSAGRMVLGLSFAVVFLAVLIMSLRKLRALFRTLRDGDPFVPANAGRIRFLAFALIGFELLYRGWIFWSYFAFVMNQFGIDGLELRPLFDPSFAVLFAGLALLVIAEVFQQGAEMKREQELTV
jgi:hypothetical protein